VRDSRRGEGKEVKENRPRKACNNSIDESRLEESKK
jgi:hypothetical protein